MLYHEQDTVSAREAASLLGVKRATLYTYVSRGVIRTVPDPASARKRRYLPADVLSVRTRSNARPGHGPVAGSALDWGEPVLETSICRIDPVSGPMYRGVSAIEACQTAVPFEDVVALLCGWEGVSIAPSVDALRPGDTEGFVFGLMSMLSDLAGRDPALHIATRASDLTRVRHILGAALRAAGPRQPTQTETVSASLFSSLASTSSPTPDVGVPALNQALVLCAEHELNASSFTARVAASAGAGLYACVIAALGTFSGPLHG